MTDFLLLHGMNVGGWEWERVVPLLQADARVGTVLAPDFPGRGPGRPEDLGTVHLPAYLDTILTAMRAHDLRDVILVGHSGGGACLQAAAAAEPERVRRLVFLCAAVPKRGHSLLDWQPAPLRLLTRLSMWIFRAGRRGIVPSKRLARRVLCNGLQPADCDRMVERLVPEPRALLTEPLAWEPERMRAPATYVLTTRDRIIRPRDQLRMAETIPGIEVVRIPAGHAQPVVYPQWLVERLLQYV